MFLLWIAVVMLLIGSTTASSCELRVSIISGPTECEGSDLITTGKYVSMHYEGVVDESSTHGEIGAHFHSSRTDTKDGEAVGIRVTADDDFDMSGPIIKAFDIAVRGLCKGVRAQLIVPTMSKNPPGQKITLRFAIDIVDVSDKFLGANEFARMDTDYDGQITMEEWITYLQEYHNWTHDYIPDDIWDKADTNGDNIITWDEFDGPKGDVDPTKEEL